MANNPLDINAFRHYLIFTSLGRTDLYEICEPIGFDAANFVQDQENKRYARSVQYGSLDKLTFVDAYGLDTGTAQTINPQGDQSTHLEFGLQWLLSLYKEYGFETKVEYVLEKSGVQFSNGMLDFTEKGVTDGSTFVACKLIQKTKVANLKRRLDDKFNLFGVVDAQNNAITPAVTVDFLRKATPITNISIFNGNGTAEASLSQTAPNGLGSGIATQTRGVNNSNKIIEYGINNTLSFLSPVYATVAANDALGNPWMVPNASLSFTYIEAQNDLSNVQIDITNINATSNAVFQSFGGTTILTGSGYAKLLVVVGNDLQTEPFTAYELWDRQFEMVFGSNGLQAVPSSFSLNIPAVERGKRIYIYFASDTDATFNNFNSALAGARVFVNLNGMDIKITATETALNTVIKGVRWIDGIKQASKFTSNIPVNAVDFDVNGIHYDNVIFGRGQVSQRVDNFTATPKILLESVEEVNADYEPDENEIFIGHQRDYYQNTEIAVFNVIPDEDFTIQENDRCMINKAVIGYKTYQQDRTVKGTSEAIHTEAEFRFLNENVENVFERKFDFVRDPFTIQAMVDLEVTSPSTSTSEDDKVYISNITALAPGSFNEFGARLLMRINDVGRLEILNRDSQGDTGSVVINWTILGFQPNDNFEITFGENIGLYTVTSMTASVLTLTPFTSTPTYEGDAFIRMKFFYTNVLYVTRTDEGFTLNDIGLQNAVYSIKRNMGYFGEYFASCLLYSRKDIINGYFKSNGAFTSQLVTEASPVTEKDNILYSDLPTPLTTAKVLNATCVAEFEDILSYLNNYKTVARGFARLLYPDGSVYRAFLKDLDHLWLDNKLKTAGEQKYETEYLILTYSAGVLTVNDAVYNLNGNSDWWKAENDYFKFYDSLDRPLSNFYRYNFVELNGIVYGTKADLVAALIAL